MDVKASAFRPDINGLRAWAVMSVVFFHFGVPGFSGGFIGVDIFFVISGYLMTGIITGKLITEPLHKGPDTANRFSIIDFYLARARRILPALIVLCLFLLVLGWFYLSARDYKMLGTHVISALTFISNIKFWDEAGYFDTASHEKLLLHTWSLSVEWQFYIIFPVVLVVLWKLIPNRRFMGLMLVAGFLASLAVSVIMTPKTPSAAFYLLPTRAWEMLAGGLVYFYAQQRLPNPYWATGLELTGFGLILLSLIFFDASTPWPGYHALVPTVGSVLVLLAARSTSVFTGTRPAQWLGKTSYSIYLWHWPLSVALIYLELDHHWGAISVSMVLTLMLGWASWAYVEQPAGRRLIRFKKLPQIAVTCGLVLLVAVPAAGVRLKEGVYGRLDPKVGAIFAERENDNPRKVECRVPKRTTAESCTYGGNELGIIVLGDSHAQSVVRSVERSLPSSIFHVLDWTMNSCATIIDIKSTIIDLAPCRAFIRSALEMSRLLDRSAPIFIVNRLSTYMMGPNEPDRKDEIALPNIYISDPYPERSNKFFAELQAGIVETACAFAQHRPVYMLRPIPEMKLDVPRTMGRAAIIWGQERRVSITLDEYEERHRIAWAAQDRAAEECGVILLDPRPYLCSDGRCWGDADGLPLYIDDDHLSERGGQLLIPLFKQMFNTNDLPQVSQNQ
jgi:peptidoglycan/LPS O-acetylase OafA/YrhL